MARLALLLLATPALLVQGAFVNFHNCLDPAIVHSDPLQLQWVPLFFSADFSTSRPNNLNVTLYGNVSGQQIVAPYPPPDSPHWSNPKETLGKIVNVGTAHNFSTLLANFDVLSFSAYDAKASQFCPHLIDGQCPLGPLFDANASDPADLHAFSIAHDLGSAYTFSTLAATIRVISGDVGGPELVCVTANITPDLGPRVAGLITWLPAAILILKALATVSAAIWSPWGSSDIFRWSSNYGRDEDLLRLVTPGFGDCLQYIQFVTLMGSLTLQYPGFFQPAVSQTSWSLLLFNQSFVSHGPGTQSLIDGIYVTNGTYGLDHMRQLIGMSRAEDLWACMAVFFLAIAVGVVILCQLGFFGRWIYRTATKTSEEDLRRKNLPFTLGNMVRLMFNYFILPIVALSLFQLVISPRSEIVVVVFAVVLIVVLIASAGWIMRVIFTTKPRPYLFDDMSTVLLYGPLYNTYSDNAAPFTLVPVIITFMRGVAFGAVQPSGIGQIIVLAICEVILILTLNGFRPFQNQTSMNAYHTFFAVVRLITVLLSIAFVPSLGVGESSRGWVGYAILLLHACVLVFGFFLNSAQTLIEVTARSLGVAGHDAQTGAIRGSILSWRMLKKRKARPAANDRASMTSNAAILRTSQADEGIGGPHSRSISGSSHQLLNQAARTPSMHRLSGFENFSSVGDGLGSPGQDADGVAGFTYLAGPNGGHVQGKPSLGAMKNEENFYRPPRQRSRTIDALLPGAKSRSIGSGDDFPYQDYPVPQPSHNREVNRDNAASPAPAYIRDRSDSNENVPRTDYAVREVDQYYRGPALSDQPTRKLKTGPADPEGPAASAQSWFQKLVFGVKGNKKKDQSKGFEVVRSSRMPPGVEEEPVDDEDAVEMQTSPPTNQEPYRDSPPMQHGETQALEDADLRRPVSPISEDGKDVPEDDGFNFGFDGPSAATSKPTSVHPGMRAEQPSTKGRQSTRRMPSRETADSASNYNRISSEYQDSEYRRSTLRYSTNAPSIGPIEGLGGDFSLLSRLNSQRSGDTDDTELANTSSGQDWLRQVDRLDWTSHARPALPAEPPTATAAAATATTTNTANHSQIPRTSSAPRVPRRSSRRFGSRAGDDFDGFNSAEHSDAERMPPPPPPAPSSNNTFLHIGGALNDGDERASSVMNTTSHHRAADSINRNSFGARQALQETSAEILASSPPEEGGFGGAARR